MTHRTSAVAACMVTVLACGFSVADAATTLQAVDTAALRARVASLTAPALAGRGAGTPEAAATADTLAAWFAAAGLEPAFGGEWLQEFLLSGEGWQGDDLSGRTGRNVAGVQRGAGDLADRWIVVAAHLDHLGRTESAADDGPPARGAYYPGANDNASGVAIVQTIVRNIVRGSRNADGPGSRRGVLFVHFDGEEVGLLGSRHFVEDPPVPLDRIDAMINLDTVGRLLDGKLYVSGIGTAAALPDLVEKADHGGLILSLAHGAWSGSDHMIFNAREIPVVFLFGGPYPEYNRPTDAADRLDYEAMDRVASFAAALLEGLRRVEVGLQWVRVGESDPGARGRATTENGAQNRQTWLGTLPDFSEDVVGYRLAGVFDGSPASRAGLQKGDVLVKLGEREVSDLATFTRALRSRDPNDVVDIVLRRDGRRLKFTVVLGNRADRR